MFEHAQFIEAYDDLVPDDYCNRMVERFGELENTTSGQRGEDIHGIIARKDISYYFDQDAPDLADQTHLILQNALARYSESHPAFAMMPCYANEVKVKKTSPKGGYHIWHPEKSNQNGQIMRCLVWSVYLNDTPEGEGTTEFLELGVKVQPKAGRVVLFPADWTHTHRGNPMYSGTKYLATGWFLSNE